MASKWWKESYCWEKLGNLDTGKALQVLRYCDKATMDDFLRKLSFLLNETSINGENLKNFVGRHKPIINLILSGGMSFDTNDEAQGMSSKYGHISTKDSMLFSLSFHMQFCECFLLSVLGRQGPWESSLKDISLDGDSYPLSRNEVVALCANLSSNSNVLTLNLRNQKVFRSKEGCRLLGQALRTNSALEELFLPSTNLGSKGVERLMYGLEGDTMSNLKVLDVGMNDNIGDAGLGYIAKMLKNNTKLKILHLKGTGCGLEGARQFSAALLVNSTLELFSFGANPVTREGMNLLLSPLTRVLYTTEESQSNSTVKHLELEHMDPLDFSVETVALMITSNKTLESLNITGVLLEERDWIELVIPALNKNKTLKYIAISGSNVLPLDSVVELITSTSRKICRSVANEESNAHLSVRLQFGRIILCGYKFAGKTTIWKTMRYLSDGPPAFHYCNVAWKKFRKKVILLRKSLFGTHALGTLEECCRGCNVVRLRNEKQRIIFDVWDFAGQKEYFALHSSLFCHFSNSCFLYVCSAVFHKQRRDQSSVEDQTSKRIKDQKDIRKELEYWIHFIASSYKPFLGGVAQHAHRPRVIFVLTNKDELNKDTLHYVSKSAEHVVADLKERYHSVVDLQEFVTVVDSHSCKDVKHLVGLAEKSLEEVLERSTDSAACEQVRDVLESWSLRNSSKPFLSLADFNTLCEEELGASLDRYVFSAFKLHSTEGQVAVLNQLHNSGDITFLSSRDLIVVNPRRFGLKLLGSIIKALRGARLESGQCEGAFRFCKTCLNSADHGMGLHHQNGFVREQHLKEIADRLEHISWKEFLNLLTNLELCFEATTESSDNLENRDKLPGKVFVPAVFDDEEETAILGRRQVQWSQNMHRHDFYYVFIGRRLECDTSFPTVFTPGFFPRLQVFLHNFFMAKGWLDNQAFQLDRNLIGFYENGVEVLVEYSGAVGYFVDVLVKSSRPFSYTLDFIRVNVIHQIREFCSTSKGCPGVVLVESVIRPLSVKDLHLCVDRINQTVLISSLHRRIKENGYNYTLAWPDSIRRVSNVQTAAELLGGGKCPLLKHSNTDKSVCEADGSENDSIQKSATLEQRKHHDRPQSGSTSETKSMEETVRRGFQMEGRSEITAQPVVQRCVSAIAPYEQERPSTSYPGGGDDHKSNEQHLPSLFYPTADDVGYLSSLWAKIEAKKAVKIHLMCESPRGFHYVSDQRGRILNLRTGRSTVMEHILTFIRQSLTGTAQLAGMDVDASWFQGLFGSSLNMPIKVEDLLRITDRCNPSAPASDDEILASLALYLKIDRSTQWLKDFLNMENPTAFRHDFDLWMVTNTNSWVCVQHYVEILRERYQLSNQES